MPRDAARPRRPLYLLILLALAALALWSFWPRALEVESARVQRAPLSVGFTEEARTRLRQRYTVSAPLDGVIDRVTLEPGDAVAAGATVAMLRPANAALFDPASRAQATAQWQAARDLANAAQASVAAAAAERDRSAAALRRGQSLAAGRLIATSDLDALRAQAASADATLRAAQAASRAAAIQRDGARAVLDLQGAASKPGQRLALRSPVDGTVLRRVVESEGPVRAGQPLLELGHLGDLEVVAELLTSDAMRVAVGNPVRLLRSGTASPLHGHIRVIEPGGFTKVSALGVEEQRVLAVIALDDPPATRPGLGDGYRVEAEFVTWRSASTLTVPTAALFRDGSHWAVYAIEDGRARLRRVGIGQVGDAAAQLTGGLAQGARVVLYPGDTIHDGQRVDAD